MEETLWGISGTFSPLLLVSGPCFHDKSAPVVRKHCVLQISGKVRYCRREERSNWLTVRTEVDVWEVTDASTRNISLPGNSHLFCFDSRMIFNGSLHSPWFLFYSSHLFSLQIKSLPLLEKVQSMLTVW
jgi:hypothetical protein